MSVFANSLVDSLSVCCRQPKCLSEGFGSTLKCPRLLNVFTVGTFRAGLRGLSTQSSLKCLFVCLFVCLFIFTHNQKSCTVGDKSLRQISKQHPLHEQKLLVSPASVHNQNSKVCLFVCLFIFRHKWKLCTIGDKFSDISNKHPLHEQKILAPPRLV